MNIFNKIIMVLFLIIIVLTSFVAIVNEFVGYFTWSDVSFRLFDAEIHRCAVYGG